MRVAVACACTAVLLTTPLAAHAERTAPGEPEVQAASTRQLAQVFLSPYDGSDGHDGASAEAAVKTFGRAKQLLAPGGRIVLQSPIRVESKTTLSLEGKGDARVVRGARQTGPMITLEENADLTLEYITFDGGLEGENLDSIVSAHEPNCSLTLGDGAILQNNNAAGGHYGAAIAGWDGLRLVMNDGAEVRGNSSHSAGYGAIMLANGSTFTMNGGRIANNEANRGGGVALVASSMVMNGGIIEGNRAHDVLGGSVGDGYGAGVYLSSYEEISGLPGAPNSITAGDASFIMHGGSIAGNTAESQGGGILGYPMANTGDIVVSIDGGSVDGNVAEKGNGGGIALYDLYGEPTVELELMDCSVSKNVSPALGGGVFLYGMGGTQASFASGRIEQNAAGNGGGVAAYGGSVLNMTGGAILDNEARAGGGVMVFPSGTQSAQSVLKMSGGRIAGNNHSANRDQTKGDGVFQGGVCEISGTAVVDGNNDVFLPSGRIIDVVNVFEGATRVNPVSITSEDCVVEPVDASVAGTKLVRYHEAAGGVDSAARAQGNQLFVPSEKMLKVDPTLYIGKSMHAGQVEYMTYIVKPAIHGVTYRYVGDVPAGADELLPAAERHAKGELVEIAPAPVVSGYQFLGWRVATDGVSVDDGSFAMPDQDVLIEGAWKKLPSPDSDPGAGAEPPAGDSNANNGGGRPQGGISSALPQTGDGALVMPVALAGLCACAAGLLREWRRCRD